MFVDLGALGVVLLFVLFGYISGLMVQLVRIASLVAAFFVAHLLGAPVAGFLSRGLGMGEIVAHVGAFVAIFLVVYGLLRLVGGSLVTRIRQATGGLTFLDRSFGGIVGGLKGGVFVYLILAVFAAFRPSIASEVPELDRQFGASVVGREILRHNLVMEQVVPRAEALTRLVRILQEPVLLEQHKSDPNFVALLEHPKGKFLLDPAIQAAIAQGHWEVLWEDGRVFAFFADDDALALFNAIDLAPPTQASETPAEAP